MLDKTDSLMTHKTRLSKSIDLHACLYDVIEMECSGNNLLVVDAVYGQHASCDPAQCCAPTQQDCQEAVADADPDTWANLRLACNYEQTCQFQYQSEVNLESCGIQNPTADYLALTYACYSEGMSNNCPSLNKGSSGFV